MHGPGRSESTLAGRAERRLGARLSIGIRVVGCRGMMQRPSGRPVYLCIGALGTNVRTCRDPAAGWSSTVAVTG